MYVYSINIKSNFNKVDVATWTNNIITFGAIGHVHVA